MKGLHKDSIRDVGNPYKWMISEKMEEYLRKEFMHNTLPKYYKYFNE